MGAYEGLNNDIMNLGDLPGAWAEVQAAAEQALDDEDVQERKASVAAVIQALESWGGLDSEAVKNNRGLIAEDYFEEYAQDKVVDVDGISHHSVCWRYIDWDGLTDDLRAEYEEVEIKEGEFAGTWLMGR